MGYLLRNLMKLNFRLNKLNFCQTIKKIIFKQQKIENEKEFKNLLISSNILKRYIEDSNDNVKFCDIIIKDYNNEYDEYIENLKEISNNKIMKIKNGDNNFERLGVKRKRNEVGNLILKNEILNESNNLDYLIYRNSFIQKNILIYFLKEAES